MTSSFLSQQRPQKAAVSLTTGLSRPPNVCLRNSGVQEPMSAYLLMLRVILMSASMGLCQGWDTLGPATHYGRSSFFLCLQGLPHSTWYVSWCWVSDLFLRLLPLIYPRWWSLNQILCRLLYMLNSLALMLLPASYSSAQSHLLLRASVLCLLRGNLYSHLEQLPVF